MIKVVKLMNKNNYSFKNKKNVNMTVFAGQCNISKNYTKTKMLKIAPFI